MERERCVLGGVQRGVERRYRRSALSCFSKGWSQATVVCYAESILRESVCCAAVCGVNRFREGESERFWRIGKDGWRRGVQERQSADGVCLTMAPLLCAFHSYAFFSFTTTTKKKKKITLRSSRLFVHSSIHPSLSPSHTFLSRSLQAGACQGVG